MAQVWCKKNAIILVIVSAIVAVVLEAVNPASELLISNTCKPEGHIAKLKSFVQGSKFWAGQIEHLDRRVRFLETEPERRKKLQAQIDEALEETEKFMEAQHFKYPSLRPAMADKLAEVQATLHDLEIKEIERLSVCRLLLLNKVH